MLRRLPFRAVGRLFLLSLLTASAAADSDDDSDDGWTLNFKPYGSGFLRDCMEWAHNQTKCLPADTAELLYECVCDDRGVFMQGAGYCLKRGNDENDDFEFAYKDMTRLCDEGETPLDLSWDQWASMVGFQDETTTTTSEVDETTTSPTSSEQTSTQTTPIENSPASPTETTDDDEDGNEDEGKDNSSDLSTGAIVGIAIGGTAALALAGVLFWCLRRRHRQQNPGPEVMAPGTGGFQNPHAEPTTYYPPGGQPMQNAAPGFASTVYEPDHKNDRFSTVSAFSMPGPSPRPSPSNTGSPLDGYARAGSWGPSSIGSMGAQQHPQSLHPGGHSVPFQAATSPYASASPPPHLQETSPSEISEMPGSQPTQYTPYRPPPQN